MSKEQFSFHKLLEEARRNWVELHEKDGVLYIGTASCGKAAGASKVIEAVEKYKVETGRDLQVVEVGCIGMCGFEPMVYVQAHGIPPVVYGGLAPRDIPALLDDILVRKQYESEHLLGVLGEEAREIPALSDHPMMTTQERIILPNCGIIDPTSIEHYIANGGYEGLRKALQMDPLEVIEEVKKSGLRGRGGAGFPTGLKWQFTRQAEGEGKYVICNADEGDPGAFMDRSTLEGDPHKVLEGMIIAAYAIGATSGYIYLRAEYPLAIKRFREATRKAEEAGFLGESIMGSNFHFQVSVKEFRVLVKEGAGAFVCGEETALIASIMGKRGMPRPKPPYPAQSGVHGKPTVINNVKTLATIPVIMSRGSSWFSTIGTKKSPGTAVFALTGKIANSGLIEVPMGTTLRKIIYEIGGGIPDRKKFKAVQTGGPSGGCLPASQLDLPVNYEELAKAGSIMGSGGMVVMDEDSCMVDIARYFLSFTQEESCGKCPPCRIGTKRMLDILTGIKNGEGTEDDLAMLEELAPLIKNASLCGLGQTAPNPVLTTLQYFRHEYEAHIHQKRCPAHSCRAFISYRIDSDACIGCGLCKKHCPVNAISGRKGTTHVIDQEACVRCGMCLSYCPVKGKAVEKVDRKEVEA